MKTFSINLYVNELDLLTYTIEVFMGIERNLNTNLFGWIEKYKTYLTYMFSHMNTIP